MEQAEMDIFRNVHLFSILKYIFLDDGTMGG